jgi:hypothetical protein
VLCAVISSRACRRPIALELPWWAYTCMHACKVQNGRNGTTYSSALDSARAGLALLPAAAEAKEGGAIVVVLWLEEEVAVGRIDAFEGQRFWYAECGNTSV